MRTVLGVEEVRAAEAAAMQRMPEGALMARAAAGLATACSGLLGGTYGRRVVVLAGPGSNGGDALYAGAQLARRGASVTAVALTDSPHPGGMAALRAAGGRQAPALNAELLADADLAIDGILGIGARPGLSGAAADWAAALDAAAVTVVACDLPSGLDPDTGEAPGPHVRVDLTVTFGTLKPCLVLDPGAGAAGAVEVVDIGLDLPPVTPAAPFAAVGLDDLAALLPHVPRESDKYSRGVAGLVTGSTQYPGAGLLSTAGARSGLAGMIRFVGAAELGYTVATRFPDVVPQEPDHLGRVQAWVFGSGAGAGDPTVPVARLLEDGVPLLIDADGLTHLPAPQDRPEGARLLLTPHAGELARLLDVDRTEIEAHRLRYAREAAELLEATVLLKGATTVVAAPDGRARVPTVAAPPWLATAGSGDVLSGLTGSLLAAGLAPLEAGITGAVLHAAAGRVAAGEPAGPITAWMLAEALPAALRLAVGAEVG